MQAFIIKSKKHGEHEILVDKEDTHLLKEFNWHLKFNTKTQSFYVWRNSKKFKVAALHRLIMCAADGEIVDHINHNTLDNRKSNLRICTNTENMRNSRVYKTSGKTSQYKGVHWRNDCNKYRAAIRVEKKLINLGNFEKEETAALEYNKAAIKYFGEFANINKLN